MADKRSPDTGAAASRSMRRGRGLALPLFALLLLILFLVTTAAALWLNSNSGKQFIISQIEALEPENGLRFEIGSLEGSIYSDLKIKDLHLSDPKGRFFSARQAQLDWRLFAWLFNELYIDRAVINTAKLDRFPELIESDEDQPLLPEFDIYIGDLRVQDFTLGAALAGREQQATVKGEADVRSGRAKIALTARTMTSGDRVLIDLDVEPGRNLFDFSMDVNGPAQGVMARLLSLERDLVVSVEGRGDWEKWTGSMQAQLGNAKAGVAQLADLSLEASNGLYALDGNLDTGLLPAGAARRIAGETLRIKMQTTLDEGALDLTGEVRARALRLTADGGYNLRRNSFEAMRLDASLANDARLATNIDTQNLTARALLNGSPSEIRYQYLVESELFRAGRSQLIDLSLSGKGRRSASWAVPLDLKLGLLKGNGPLLEQVTKNTRLAGNFVVKDGHMRAQNARVQSDSISGRADIDFDLSQGSYDILLDAQAAKFPVKGLGLVDVDSQIRFQPGDRPLQLTGSARADVKRLDNAFFRSLGGGLPKVTTKLNLGSDGLLRFTDLNVVTPKLKGRVDGVLLKGGIFEFDGGGQHSQYGAFDFGLRGLLARPSLSLLLRNPLDFAGLSNVRVALEPNENGFAYDTSGGSTLGPFQSTGSIFARRGEQAKVLVERLLVSNSLASGTIIPTAIGLNGSLALRGGGLGGNVEFRPRDGGQIVKALVVARNAQFNGPVPIAIRNGKLDADAFIKDGKSNVSAILQAQGISRGDLIIGRLAGTAQLSEGQGKATFSVTGTRGSSFEFAANADVKPDLYNIVGRGEFEGRTIQLEKPLRFSRIAGGWAVAPTTLRYGRGRTQFSGQWGAGETHLRAKMTAMPLSLLDVAFDELGLGGVASGSVSLSQRPGRSPAGKANLMIRGLTRSGLILTSDPVDLGLNAAISQRALAARGIVRQEGKDIGRFQARITEIGGPDWQQKLISRPLFAQARFNGTAESLWRLTGIETFDLTGPVRVSANIGGSLKDPQIRGRLQTDQARLESPLTGSVITDIKATGNFDGSRLVLPNIAGSTRGGGSIQGSGSFDLAVEPGVGIGIDLRLKAKRAALIARDDFAATVSGPLRISNDRQGGLISGDVTLDRSFFRFGQASTVVALPKIKVTEKNRRADERPVRARRQPWRFAINADLPRRLQVEGLGLDSEWQAKLKISGPVDDFAINGNADLINGNYTFAGRRFRLDRGRIRFIGNRPANPLLDIVAEADLSGLNATIAVTGTGNKPEVKFASVPALPEDELLAQLLFGASIADLSAPEAVQLASAVAALNSGGGLDPINQLRRAVGLDRLRILAADPIVGRGTSVAAGKFITRRAFVELITDGQGYSATRLEFQITRWLSLLSSISTIGRESANIRVSRDY